MWLVLAFLSAALLGFYDAFKKKALSGNAVIPVLFLNTLFSSLIFLPFIVMSYTGNSLDGTMFHVAEGGWEVHKYIVLKSFIVLSSWIFGYFGMKHLPLTIVGPINATRPVMTLVGALLVYGEVLNLYQWIGVILAIISFAMLSRSGKKGYRLQAQQMDLLHRAGCRARCNKRPLRQVSDGSTREWWCRIRQNDCAELVQHLPVFPHGSHAADDMVAYQEEFYPIPLALEYHLHQYLPFGSRLRLFLRSKFAWRHDQYREHDSPRFGHRQLPLRCSHLPREESQGEVRRSAPGITRNALPLLRNEVMIIKKSCKPMCLQDFFMFLPDMCTLVLRNKELVALLDVECLIP